MGGSWSWSDGLPIEWGDRSLARTVKTKIGLVTSEELWRVGRRELLDFKAGDLPLRMLLKDMRQKREREKGEREMKKGLLYEGARKKAIRRL